MANSNATASINNLVATTVERTIQAWQHGVGKKSFQSTATTYGQLKRELADAGYDLNNVTVTEGNTSLTLANDDAVLPTNISARGTITNDLIIVITPNKNIKSGAIDPATASYKDMKAFVKSVYAGNTVAQAHFGNYTQMPTLVMRNKITIWLEMQTPRNSAKKKEEIKNINAKLEKGDHKVPAVEAVDKRAEDFYVTYTAILAAMLKSVVDLQNLAKQFSPKYDLSEEDFKAMARKISPDNN